MWWLFYSSDVSDAYDKLSRNEPLKYRRKRSRVIAAVFLVIFLAWAGYQFFVYRCYKEVGDYDVCRSYGWEIDKAKSVVEKQDAKQVK